MKKLLPVCLIAFALCGTAFADTIWSEDFSSYVDAGITGAGNSGGYPSSVTKWNIDVSNCTLADAADYFMAVDTSAGRMEAVDIDGEAIWTSESIDISGYTNVSLSVDTSETGSSVNVLKYVQLYYKLNGGSETPFSVNPTNSGDWGSATATQGGLSGSTIQIIARVNNPNAGDASIFDNVTVSGDLGTSSNSTPVLDSIGDQVVLEGGDLSFSVTASDPDDDPITLSATNLPTGAVFTNGTFTWNTAAPAGAYDVTFTATDEDGSDSEIVTITVVERPLLMISEVADPDETGADVFRFVELYNTGTNAIDLAANNWHLSRQVNGGSWCDLELTGTVSAAGTWVIANSSADFATTYGFTPDQADGSVVDGNGDDAYALFYGGDSAAGTLIDIYGNYIDGTGTAWDYENSRAERNNSVFEPNTTWTASEWALAAGATTNDMNPGVHGPTPEFIGLEDVFVWLGDNLSLTVTAVNTMRTDVITLSASVLPAGATFPTVIGTNTVSGALSWTAPTAGGYTATFDAAGDIDTTTKSITITVSGTDAIDGQFYGWTPDTIVKLDNGQFWRNTGGAGSIIDPPFNNPDVTVTNALGSCRMYVETVASYTTVEPIDVTESSVVNSFTGLHNGNTYQLADGTAWEQVSFENISSSADPVIAWRWEESGDTFMRFLDTDDAVIGTCEVIITTNNPPANSQIDGYFRGWRKDRIFVLKNGDFWQQTSYDSSTETIHEPTVIITNWLQSGIWRMVVDGADAPGYVEVQPRTDVIRTAIDGTFYGFGNGKNFHLQNGMWWKQTSFHTSASTRSNPEILLWEEDGTTYMEMPDEGRTVISRLLNVVAESSITNTFEGLHYANTYELASGDKWIQISFENVSTNLSEPFAMLWTEYSTTNLLMRSTSDTTIGDCEVVDPNADDDNDQIANAAEIIAGTDRVDNESFFQITETTVNGSGHYVISWIAIEGRDYTILWTPSLTNGFQELSTVSAPTNSWTDTGHTPETESFYKLEVGLTP